MIDDGPVGPVNFSPDGRTVVTGSQMVVRRWDVATAKPIGTPMQLEGKGRLIFFNSDLVADAEGLGGPFPKHQLWSLVSGKPIGDPIERTASNDWSIGPDRRNVLIRKGQELGLWDAATGISLGPAMDHESPVKEWGFTPDGRTVLTLSADGIRSAWDAAAGVPLGIRLEPGSEVPSPPRSVPTDARFSQATPWEKRGSGTSARQNRPRCRSGIPLNIASPNSSPLPLASTAKPSSPCVLSATDLGPTRAAQLWDAATFKPLGQAMTDDTRILAAAFSPDGRTVISGLPDGTARLWDAVTGKPTGFPMKHDAEVWAVAFSAMAV